MTIEKMLATESNFNIFTSSVVRKCDVSLRGIHSIFQFNLNSFLFPMDILYFANSSTQTPTQAMDQFKCNLQSLTAMCISVVHEQRNNCNSMHKSLLICS